MLDNLESRFRALIYSYRWSDYVWLLDGWLARSAVTVPVIGYLILFNDSIADHIAFDKLASENHAQFGLTALARLKLLYFGLLLLGIANIIYRLRRPFVFRHGENDTQFVANALEKFTLADFEIIDMEISRQGHQTPYGDYNCAEFDAFLECAKGRDGSPNSVHWGEAKARYESLLRSMLKEFYLGTIPLTQVYSCPPPNRFFRSTILPLVKMAHAIWLVMHDMR